MGCASSRCMSDPMIRDPTMYNSRINYDGMSNEVKI